MRWAAALAVAILAAVPSAAGAQILVGVRAGYAVPWGEATAGAALGDQLAAQLPFTLDLGLSLGENLTVGAYAAYGLGLLPASASRACDAAGRSCTAADLRLGAQAFVRAGAHAAQPWVGLAVGYEELRTRTSGGGLPTDLWSLMGYDATIQAGLDLVVSPTLRVGPFANATVGRFRWRSNGTEIDLRDPPVHGWLQLGLRGSFAG